jgi:protein TonB
MELRLRPDAGDDHLMIAVFLAALLHGLLILGIRFAAPPRSDDPLPTLEVLLVPAGENEEANLDAAYMAERNQSGSGTTRDRVRASLPEPTPSAPNAGDQQGEAPEPLAGSRDAGSSTAIAARALDATRGPSGDDAIRAQRSQAPLEVRPVPQVALGAVASSEDLLLRGRSIATDELLADTRESQIAQYLDGWKRRVEKVGTLNFPNEARRRSLSGNPVLEVAIGASGQLQEVLVRRTSGYSELDHAAMNIVRLASPFDPFPPALRERYPVLRFAYEWQFLQGRPSDGAVLTDDP